MFFSNRFYPIQTDIYPQADNDLDCRCARNFRELCQIRLKGANNHSRMQAKRGLR